ncbi:hypothetical protein PENTCL1PPCAC_28047, partial [Pristionchus entomophagus]
PSESTMNGASEGAGGHFDSVASNTVGTLGSYASIDSSPSHYDSHNSPALAPPPPPALKMSSLVPPVAAQGGRSYQPVYTPRRGAQFDSLCPAVDCNFDDNNLCRYVTSTSDSDLILSLPADGKQREFGLSSTRVSNTLTGIPSDLLHKGYFAFAANAQHGSDQFVLSTTNPVAIPAAARLDFFVYLAGVHGRLRVCLDNLSNCPFELKGRDIDMNSRQWKNYHVVLPEGNHAIHIVADRLKKNYAIGVDNIQLLNRYGMAALSC